jgi:hypothetical protein
MPVAIKCAILNMTSVFSLHGCMVCLAAYTVIVMHQMCAHYSCFALVTGLACT